MYASYMIIYDHNGKCHEHNISAEEPSHCIMAEIALLRSSHVCYNEGTQILVNIVIQIL